MNILLTILAIIPGLLICGYIYWVDRKEKEKWLPLAICFVLGLLITFPALWLEDYGESWGLTESGNFFQLLGSTFLVVAFTEEFLKFLVLMMVPYPRKFFNEPLDGIVYAVMIGMGFAILENIYYSLFHGVSTAVVRAFTAVPSHAAFAIFMGFFVGQAKFEKKYKYQLLALGLFSAVIIHGLYDLFIYQEYYEWLMLFAVVVLLIAIFFARKLILIHQNNSPFDPKNVPDLKSTEPIALAPVVEANPSIADQAPSSDNEIMSAIIEDLESEEEE